MTVTARKAGLAATLGSVLLAGVLAAPGGTAAAGTAIITYQTISGAAQCTGTSECTATFTDTSGLPARLATTTPIVVQTGHLPGSGPGLPVSLLTGVTGDVGSGGQQGYRFRVLDQNGAVAATTTQAYFHASVPFVDSGRVAGSVLVNTDASGNGRANFPAPLSAAPVAVIATGRSPYVGPGLPVNLITSGFTADHFLVRALDQTGAPIANASIRLHYWATVQAATPNTRAGQAVVTPNANGWAFVPWPMFAVGLVPISVVLTGMAPATGPAMPVNLLAVSGQSNGVLTRVLNQSGSPITTPVRIAFYATKLAASEV